MTKFKTIVALALGVMLILSGCSTDSDSSGTSNKVSPSTATATNINGSTAATNETDDVIISTGENKAEETIEAIATDSNATQNAVATNGSAAATASPSGTIGTQGDSSSSSSNGSSSNESIKPTTSTAATNKPNGASATAKPTSTAAVKPTQTQAPTKQPTTTSKPSGNGSSSNGSTKPTTSTAATNKPSVTTATAKPTSTVAVKPTQTKAPTKKPTATPTATSSQQKLTYSFYPSSVTVYSGDSTPVNLKIKDSNGKTVSLAELDLAWYDYDGEGNLNFSPGASQRSGAYTLSDSNIAQLSAMRYTDGTEKLTTSGRFGKLGTCTVKVRHISGQILTLTVKSIKDPKYAAYYHPYDFAAIDADLKEYVEAHNGVYDTTLDPSFAGYYPGDDIGGYTLQGKVFYEYCRKIIFHVISSDIASNPHSPATEDNWCGMRFYLWRQHTSGTIGADDECYLFRALYG